MSPTLYTPEDQAAINALNKILIEATERHLRAIVRYDAARAEPAL